MDIPKGQAFINNVDIAEYGAVLVRGWREELLKPASAKSYITNTSRLENGSRLIAKASNVKLQSRTISLTVLVVGESEDEYLSRYESFLNAITQGAFILNVPSLKEQNFHLVYTSCEKFGNYGLKCGKFVCKFTEPDPTNRQ